MGEVFRARDTKLGREVAIKVLPAAVAQDAERIARFRREAQLLAALHHPNVASIFGLEESDGTVALVMELVDGEDLAQLLSRGAIPVDEAIAIAKRIADGLEAAHERGIVHRDLKPANVKLGRDGAVKILDFGLAKAFSGDDAASTSSPSLTQSPTMSRHMTEAGMILGTAAYMSPEQARGRPVDKRADIWSFGVVLHEMLTGVRLFQGETASDVLAAVLTRDPDWTALPESVPPAARRVLRKCLQRDVRLRLHDIADARLDLEESGEAPGAPTLAVAPGGRRPGVLPSVAGALVLVAVAGGVSWWAARCAGSASPGMPIEPDLARVTSDSGLTTDPAVAPNGSLLAYASDRGSANLNIWVQPLPTGPPVQVTRDDADSRQPSFSPDGSRIVFRSERDGGGVYVVPALGGAERLVAPKGMWPRYSPDGRRIAYEAGGRGSSSELWIVDEAGGVPTRVAPQLKGAGGPVWSPDGAAIGVMGVAKAGELDWFRIDAASGSAAPMNATSVLKSAGVPVSFVGAWLPGEIVFSAKSGDSASLWSVGVSADGRRVTGPVRRLTAGTAIDQSPTVASDPHGRALYFASLDRRTNLYGLPVAANEGRATGNLRALTDAAADDEWPSVSADGRVLVFSSNRQSLDGAWLQDLDTRQETFLGTIAGAATVSPDGQRVVYRTRAKDHATFVVQPVGGGAVQAISRDFGHMVWDWPRASLLVTGGGTGEAQGRLHAFDLGTGKLRPLLTGTTGQYYGHGRLSPDGRWMSAMEWTTAGRSRLIVFPFRDTPAPPSEWVVVSDEESVAEENAWSPDGRFLYFVSERDGSRCLWVRQLDPATKKPVGPPTAVAHLHGSRRSMIPTSASPARLVLGRNELIFSMQLQRGNIWKVALKGER